MNIQNIDINNLPSKADVSEMIREQWRNIVATSGCIQEAEDFLPAKTIKILGASYKTEKSLNEDAFEDATGRLSAVVYLAPADLSGRDVCPGRTNECTILCLGRTSGRMVMTPVKQSMVWKTALRFGAPDLYFTLLCIEIKALIKKARKLGLAPRVRLDGTSDIGDSEKLCGLFPDCGFYEYTKIARRANRWLDRMDNLHVALSFTGYNKPDCIDYTNRGGVVAVVTDLTRHDAKPSTHWGIDVIDGDKHDDVSADPRGSIRMLSWKGPRTGLAPNVAGVFAERIKAA
jgi:hypothetical protein